MNTGITFEGKNVAIVGSGSIGRATALHLAENGARGVFCTRSSGANVELELRELQGAFDQAGNASTRLFGAQLDVNSADSRRSAIMALNEAFDRQGGIDLIVLTAGGVNKTGNQTKRTGPDPVPPEKPAAMTERLKAAELWRSRAEALATERQTTYGINAVGPLQFLDELTPHLLVQDKPCCVISICSAAPRLLMSGVEAYCEAKRALEVGTQAWGVGVAKARCALGLEPHRAVPLVWGWSEGAQNRSMLYTADGSPTWRYKQILAKHPGGKAGTVEQIASAILFISSCDYLTIEPFVVAGGAIAYGAI